jgi:hypothetical protein
MGQACQSATVADGRQRRGQSLDAALKARQGGKEMKRECILSLSAPSGGFSGRGRDAVGNILPFCRVAVFVSHGRFLLRCCGRSGPRNTVYACCTISRYSIPCIPTFFRPLGIFVAPKLRPHWKHSQTLLAMRFLARRTSPSDPKPIRTKAVQEDVSGTGMTLPGLIGRCSIAPPLGALCIVLTTAAPVISSGEVEDSDTVSLPCAGRSVKSAHPPTMRGATFDRVPPFFCLWG